MSKSETTIITKTADGLNIHVGDTILANGEKFVVTDEPYLPDDLDGDSAIDDCYTTGEFIIPVNNGGAIYESEVTAVYTASNKS